MNKYLLGNFNFSYTLFPQYTISVCIIHMCIPNRKKKEWIKIIQQFSIGCIIWCTSRAHCEGKSIICAHRAASQANAMIIIKIDRSAFDLHRRLYINAHREEEYPSRASIYPNNGTYTFCETVMHLFSRFYSPHL